METLNCAKLIIAVFGTDIIEAIVRRWLKELRPRERQILELRFGLRNDTTPQTLEAVSKELGAPSRERVRQIENKTLRSIRMRWGFDKRLHKIFATDEMSNDKKE